ncbi:hypothetical protein ACTFIY_000397 [Dictyostelium cf. discoideum]
MFEKCCLAEPFAKKWVFGKHVLSKHNCTEKVNCPLEHHDKTDFRCGTCNKYLSSKQKLFNHITLIHNKNTVTETASEQTIHDNDKIDLEELVNTLQGRLTDKEINKLLKDSPGLN